MTNIRTIINCLLLLLTPLVVACQVDTDEPPQSEVPLFEFTDTASHGNICDIESDTEAIAIEFNVDVAWELRFVGYDNEAIDWVTADKRSGEAGKHRVILRFAANTSPDNRLARIEVCDVATRGLMRNSDDDVVNMVNSFQGVCYVVSILQRAYYSIEYPRGLQILVTPEHNSLKSIIDAHIAENNITYDAIEYLDIRGDLGSSVDIESNYHFINTYLLNLKVLNLRYANMTTIPRFAFYRNRSIHYVVLPNNLRKIEQSAFEESELRNVNLYIPPTVDYVGTNAFYNTQISGSIVLSNYSGNIYLGNDAFNTPYIFTAVFCEGISNIDGGEPFNKFLTVMVLPSTLNSIHYTILHNVGIICCHPTIPPQITGSANGILLNPSKIGAVLVPFGSYLLYIDETSLWSLLNPSPGLP